jgi:hypothetical protein
VKPEGIIKRPGQIGGGCSFQRFHFACHHPSRQNAQSYELPRSQ